MALDDEQLVMLSARMSIKINKKLLLKFFKKHRILKTGIYVKETFQLYMCTNFQVDILKNGQLMAF